MDLINIQLKGLLKNFEINFALGILKESSFTDDLMKLLSTSEVHHDVFLGEILKRVINSDYSSVLNMNIDFLKPLGNFYRENSPVFNFENGEMKSNYSHLIFTSMTDTSYVKQLTLLLIAVAALQEFLKANLSGPNFSDEATYAVLYNLLPEEYFPNDLVLDALSKNGETIITKISHPKLLYLSLLLLSAGSLCKCLTYRWWLIRCLMMHQRIIHETIPDLHNSILILMKQLMDMEFLKGESQPLASILFLTECAHVHLHYHEVNLAEKYIIEAGNMLNLQIELSGAIGKRTRFQSKPVAQLMVKTIRNDNVANQLAISSCFPKDLALEDDTLLNKIEYINIDDCKSDKILPEEQIIVLAHCCLKQKKMAATDLKQEEIMSYVNFLLSQPKIWSIQFKALTLRCQAEKTATRKFERSLTQLEELINTTKKEEPPFSIRETALYCTSFPFKYNLEKLLAELLINMGSIKSALEIFERLHLWEDAVICYKQLGMTSKAVEVLNRLIAKKPSPVLWCYLGDVTDDPEKYITAWELSGHKNSRSQRALGYYYFKRKDYEKCISHFILSTDVNHLQPTVWFTLGYAATEVGNYELAARAYRQVVLLDNDNFEAWNNLSNAYIKLKQKERAWRSLQEALKCNYEEWKVWENFLIVSVDVGAFEDVIRSYHRLLDVKGKHVDTEVLQILVNAIEKNLPDIHDSSSSRLKDKTLQLFGRVTSITTNKAELWELYSVLQCCGTDFKNNKDILDKAVTFQHKAIRSYIQNSDWEEEINAFNLTLMSALRFADLSIAYVELLEEPSLKQQQKSIAKYSLQNIITKADRASSRFSTNFPGETLTSLKNSFHTLINL